MTQSTLDNLSREDRRFPPPDDLAAHANVTADAYDHAEKDRLGFWAEAASRLTWATEPKTVLDDSRAPFYRWFPDGELNVSYNCIDRHVEAGNGDRVAIHWVGEPLDTGSNEHRRDLTYAQLKDEVSRAANALISLGVQDGDRVAIYMPMIPEAVIAMQACARIGAVHTVVFGGFSAEALAARIEDCQAKVVITSDGGYRRGAPAALKPAVDEAVTKVGGAVEHVVVVRRTGQDVTWNDDVDVWWHDVVDSQSTEHEPQPFNAEHPLFVMYTSGTTGKPKGILHTTGGYLTQASWTHHAVFDLKPETDVYWCTADVGWITGHSYIAYGPLANGVSQVLYEGTPDSPERGRWWKIIQDLKVTIFYTAPTAIRACMKQGDAIPGGFDLTSLRILGSVGEPINPEAYVWYRRVIGGDRAPVVDTWWQTETGAIMISPLPGVTHGKPGSAMTPLPGISADVVDDKGESVPNGSGGYLVVTEPWPSMLRTIWGDDDRYVDTYWSMFKATEDRAAFYFAGDGAKKDEDGDLWVLGRVDDVMNVSGHRLSTTEIESALVSHPAVAESAVVGATDVDTGQAVVAFVILKEGVDAEGIERKLSDHVRSEIGPIAKPREIMIVPELPKTRSGKIMRRLLRDVAEKRDVGDTTTLADASIMQLISAGQSTNTGD
ncbi:acetate--CoA ligase [Nocardioides sp. Kera G14]|uniref:acetate--CoA ligase n=1 Tax=Nocardioides sp. Kera G14 TaxID=2884264 RepID=UPI001D111081|nr:acetate--CoA ligase [Nocardioides sp. Kera G14]UDY23782.1 acetate--CoA ligase [Nocardioides sp. Kera G14]